MLEKVLGVNPIVEVVLEKSADGNAPPPLEETVRGRGGSVFTRNGRLLFRCDDAVIACGVRAYARVRVLDALSGRREFDVD